MEVIKCYYIIDNSAEFYSFYFKGLLSKYIARLDLFYLKHRYPKKNFFLREINLVDALILYEKKYFV